MDFKTFVTVAAVLFVYCTASTLPESVETEPKPQDPTTLPQPLPTGNPVELANVQQSEEKPTTTTTTSQESEDAPRLTCDLFASEQLCAANCIRLGKAGGYCNSERVCVCRPKENDENVDRAPCGGGCVTSSQCAAYAGTTNCRCAWFGCNLYTADADLTDVQQFEIFIKDYSGNAAMISSAERAYRKRQ